MKLTTCLTVLALSTFSFGAHLNAATSTVNEDNGATANGFGNQSVWHQAVADHPAIITTGGGAPGAGWDFSSSLASLNLSGIGFIQLTVSLVDGNSGLTDTGPSGANFDFNHLYFYVGGTYDPNTGLYSGGINTGILLNGFNAGESDTVTFSLTVNPGSTGAAILAQLNANGGRLSGFVVSDNTADTPPNGNQMLAGNSNLPSNATTTLVLSAVPEPATLALIGTGLLIALAPQVRRFRRNL